jgi:putative ABC transport system permease protein
VNVLESIRTSISEILAHKLRSMLTLVGIVLGTTSLVVMVSVIGGLAVAVQKGLSDLGFDGVLFVVARPSTDRLEQKKPYSHGLRGQDLAVLEAGADLIEGVAPVIASEPETALMNGRSLKVQV